MTKSKDLKVVQGTIPFKGYETWYERVGESEPGKAPLLTLHGGPGALHNYLKSLDGVAELGREVIYYDQLGCGNSPTPYLPDLWTEELWQEEIDVVRDALGLDQVHLLGQSWGGMLAMRYAISQPKGVKSMVVASSPASIPLWVEEANRLIEWLPAEDREAIKKGLAEEDYESPEYLAASEVYYLRHVCNLAPQPDYVEYSFSHMGDVYHVMQGYNEFMVVGKLADYDVTADLPKVTIPTLVTSGLMDEATPLIAKQIVDLIPGAKWELLKGTHLVHVELKDQYNRIVEDFFSAHDND
ncbi:MAG: proline iminopeptidase-family hydrolase [Bifidobacteriaceae bacterium]|jgi:proline-specific peptidase|nr:proline iminopeptidase-family hydrolase [Bifidobacteriaceae bacterium]